MKHLIPPTNGWLLTSWILGTLCNRDNSDQISKSVSDLEEDHNFQSEDQLPWECNICNSNEDLLFICTFDTLRIRQCCLTNLLIHTSFHSYIDWKKFATTVGRDYDYFLSVSCCFVIYIFRHNCPFMSLPHHNICLGTSLCRSQVFIGVFHLSFHFFKTKVYVSCCSQSRSTVAAFMHNIIMQPFWCKPFLMSPVE